MTYTSIDAVWWPYVFIVLAAVLPTMIWRWAGAWLVGGLDENSEWILLVRCISTALVAAIVAQFIFHPTGAMADIALSVRLASIVAGFAAFLISRNLLVAIVISELLLFTGALVL